MKLITVFIMVAGMLINLSFAVEIQILTTPGPERDQIEKQYEAQMESNTASARVLGELGIIYHMKALQKDRDTEKIRRAYKILKKAYLMDKSNSQTRAYYGSVSTLMATTVSDGMKQMKFVKSGTRLMDRAVKELPDDIGILMLRGHNSLGLPAFLQRTRYAVRDFSHILSLSKNAPQSFNAQIHFSLGQAFERLGQIEKAKAEWKLVLQLAPKSQWAEKANEKL